MRLRQRQYGAGQKDANSQTKAANHLEPPVEPVCRMRPASALEVAITYIDSRDLRVRLQEPPESSRIFVVVSEREADTAATAPGRHDVGYDIRTQRPSSVHETKPRLGRELKRRALLRHSRLDQSSNWRSFAFI